MSCKKLNARRSLRVKVMKCSGGPLTLRVCLCKAILARNIQDYLFKTACNWWHGLCGLFVALEGGNWNSHVGLGGDERKGRRPRGPPKIRTAEWARRIGRRNSLYRFEANFTMHTNNT